MQCNEIHRALQIKQTLQHLDFSMCLHHCLTFTGVTEIFRCQLLVAYAGCMRGESLRYMKWAHIKEPFVHKALGPSKMVICEIMLVGGKGNKVSADTCTTQHNTD